MGSYLLAPLLLIVVLLKDHCDATPGSDASSIPMLASGKRQHNIMRFGKRPAGGHSLIHFGKRGEEGSSSPQQQQPKHSFLYFGKREVPDLLDYLQSGSRDGSYKRGHSIMRFGKRGPNDNTHSFIRFGRLAPGEDQDDDESGDYYYPTDDKRTAAAGHSMMYFGKRSGGHSMMYFGKREDDKRAHAMIHFGKRGGDEDDWEDGKRGGGAHSMIHFGKRGPEDEDEADWSGPEEEESKRGGGAHSMIHFGKRGPEEADEGDWSSPEEAKRQHNLLRFGKKMDRKGSHAMIHFGKRETGEDKRAHAMIHFGKRGDGALANQSGGPLNRMKRDVAEHNPLITLVRYDGAEEVPTQDEVPPKVGPNSYFRPDEMWSPLYRQDKDWEDYVDQYNQLDKKDGASKNVFLRFG